jgi:hypothetical protein
MKTLRKYLLPASLLCAALAFPCRSAAMTSHFKFTGLSATASFDSFDVTGCVETSVFLQAFNNRIRTVGRPETTASVFVSMFQADNCTSTILVSASGFAELPAGALQIKRNLNSATLNTSVDVFDFVSSTTFTVDLSMTWTATGAVTVSKFHSIFRAPGFMDNFMFTGESRPAAASGSTTGLGMNFTPNPAVFAELDLVKNGDVTITHPSH